MDSLATPVGEMAEEDQEDAREHTKNEAKKEVQRGGPSMQQVTGINDGCTPQEQQLSAGKAKNGK